MFEGELTIQTAEGSKGILMSLLDSGPTEIGLAEITEFDTAGLQLLLLTQAEAARRGGSVRFGVPSQAVTEVLAIARLQVLDGLLSPEPAVPGDSSAALSSEVSR